MPKWMRTLAIVLSVLGTAYLLSLVPRPTTKPKTPPVPKEIQRFSLVSHDLALTIEYVDGAWRITTPVDVPANEGSVVNFLASLRSFTLEEVLSRRAESFPLFQVDDTSGVHLRVWGLGAKEPLDWVIGKDSPTGGHVYVRSGNGKEVYLAKGLSRGLAGAGLKMWRDTRLLPLAPEETIESVRIHRNNGTLFLEKSSDSWTVNGKRADQEKVVRMIRSLRYLSADDFVDPPESLGLTAATLVPPSADITVRLSSEISHTLRIGKPEKGETSRVLVRRDDDPHLLWVIARQIDLLTATEKELIFK